MDNWIQTNAENQKYFSHFQLIWESSKNIVIPSTVNADDAWKRFQQRTETASREPAPVKRLSGTTSWLRAASIIAVILCVGLLGYIFFDTASTKMVTVATGSTPIGDTLSDGSLVIINKNSAITYSKKFKGKKREVQLTGEAFFNVKANREKPFEIKVNDITVTVVGTSFNIKSSKGITEVVVETGIVRVTKDNQTVELRPDEKLVIDSIASRPAKEKVTDKLHQYYRSKQFVCDNTPLWKLVDVLNEVYDVKITIERPELRTLPLTTTFNNESLDQILSVIAQTFDIKVERDGQKISLN